jgi:RND family efflux transporter MFP subunit
MVVTAGGAPQVRFFSGRVGAVRRAELGFPVSGVLASLPVREGQAVAKGAVIAQLRTDEFEARLKTLQGQLDQSRAVLRSLEAGERPEEQRRREATLRAAYARLANARAESERATRLLRAGAISRSEAEASQTTYRVAQEEEQAARENLGMATVGREEDIEARRAEVRGLEGRVVEAKLQLDDCTLRAPYDGVVAQRLVEESQNVRAMEPVVRFQGVEELDIVVDVPETVMVADIRTADIVQMVAEVGGAPGVQFPLTIREIAKEADPTTQTFRVRAAMEAPKNVQILPGMTATVTVTFRRASVLGDQLLVPVSAVMTPAGQGPVVWVVGSDQTVAPRPVKVGTVTGSRIEIVEGLQPGDRIVVAGVTQLRQGQKVRDLGDALGGGSS